MPTMTSPSLSQARHNTRRSVSPTAGSSPSGDGSSADTSPFDRWVIDAEALGASTAMQTVMAQTMAPYLVDPQRIERAGQPPCVIRRARLGPLTLLDCEVPELFSGRTSVDDVRADQLIVTMTTSGQQLVEQDSRRAVLGPGDIFVVDGGRPGVCRIPDRIQSHTLVVPKALVPASSRLPDKLPAGSPTARLLGGYMRLLVRELPTLPAATVGAATRAAMALLELIAVSDEHAADSQPLRVALLPQVLRYIDSHLGDSEITTSTIADANAISVRTLHAMFTATGESVNAYIRRRRLEGSRQELISEPNRKIIDISRRWGFKNASHFARVFKATYGMAPAELRAEAATAPAGQV
jgi:AraC-like DNA-binding protein